MSWLYASRTFLVRFNLKVWVPSPLEKKEFNINLNLEFSQYVWVSSCFTRKQPFKYKTWLSTFSVFVWQDLKASKSHEEQLRHQPFSEQEMIFITLHGTNISPTKGTTLLSMFCGCLPFLNYSVFKFISISYFPCVGCCHFWITVCFLNLFPPL